MRNVKYRIVCYLRRNFRYREGTICESIYEWADNYKAEMDEGLHW